MKGPALFYLSEDAEDVAEGYQPYQRSPELNYYLKQISMERFFNSNDMNTMGPGNIVCQCTVYLDITGCYWHLNWGGQAHSNGWNGINGMVSNKSNTWFSYV